MRTDDELRTIEDFSFREGLISEAIALNKELVQRNQGIVWHFITSEVVTLG